MIRSRLSVKIETITNEDIATDTTTIAIKIKIFLFITFCKYIIYAFYGSFSFVDRVLEVLFYFSLAWLDILDYFIYI